jgi:hypothetical protein
MSVRRGFFVNSGGILDLLKAAVKGTSSLIASAFVHIESLDKTFTIVDTAVLLANLHSSLLNRVKALNLDLLKAVHSTNSFILRASFHIHSLDQALAKVYGAVLLAYLLSVLDGLNLFHNWDIVLGNKSDTLEAFKSACSFVTCALIHIESLDKTFTIVNTAVLLAYLHGGCLNCHGIVMVLVIMRMAAVAHDLNLFETV